MDELNWIRAAGRAKRGLGWAEIVDYDPRDYESDDQCARRTRQQEDAVDRAFEANHAAAPHSWAQ